MQVHARSISTGPSGLKKNTTSDVLQIWSTHTHTHTHMHKVFLLALIIPVCVVVLGEHPPPVAQTQGQMEGEVGGYMLKAMLV